VNRDAGLILTGIAFMDGSAERRRYDELTYSYQ